MSITVGDLIAHLSDHPLDHYVEIRGTPYQGVLLIHAYNPDVRQEHQHTTELPVPPLSGGMVTSQ